MGDDNFSQVRKFWLKKENSIDKVQGSTSLLVKSNSLNKNTYIHEELNKNEKIYIKDSFKIENISSAQLSSSFHPTDPILLTKDTSSNISKTNTNGDKEINNLYKTNVDIYSTQIKENSNEIQEMDSLRKINMFDTNNDKYNISFVKSVTEKINKNGLDANKPVQSINEIKYLTNDNNAIVSSPDVPNGLNPSFSLMENSPYNFNSIVNDINIDISHKNLETDTKKILKSTSINNETKNNLDKNVNNNTEPLKNDIICETNKNKKNYSSNNKKDQVNHLEKFLAIKIPLLSSLTVNEESKNKKNMVTYNSNHENKVHKEKVHQEISISQQNEKINSFGELILVEVMAAKDLIPIDVFSRDLDPYVKIQFNSNNEKKTKYLKSTLNPIFNERFVFWTNNSHNNHLIISLYDRKLIVADEKIAEIQLFINDNMIPINQTIDRWYTLDIVSKDHLLSQPLPAPIILNNIGLNNNMKQNEVLKETTVSIEPMTPRSDIIVNTSSRIRISLRRFVIETVPTLLAAQDLSANDNCLKEEDKNKYGLTFSELWNHFSPDEDIPNRFDLMDDSNTYYNMNNKGFSDKLNEIGRRFLRREMSNTTNHTIASTPCDPPVRRDEF